MRYYEIVEARRNPEQNPKESTLDTLGKYAGRKDVYVSFTSDVGKMSHGNNGKNISGSKLGINPKSPWRDTPIGIYTYPVDYVLSINGKVPFAGDAPFLYVVQSTKPLLDLNNYPEADFKRDSKKLIDMGFEDTRDEGIRTAEFDTPADYLWNWTRLAADEKTVQWPKILRSLGYSGAEDRGSGSIHEDEPTQAVFFSMDAIKVLEVIPNRFKSTEEYNLSAVTQDGYAIRDIKNPSEQVQLAAVKQNGLAIEWIIKKGITPSEQVQLAAVTQSKYALLFIKKPYEQVQLAAVKKYDDMIRFIKNPSEAVKLAASEAVQLTAVQQLGTAIRYIDNPSEAVQLAAVTQNDNAIKYIENPSEAVKKAAGL